MDEIVVLADIERSVKLTSIPTIQEPGIWAYRVYITGSLLLFMKEIPGSRDPVKVTNLIIDHKEFTRYDEIRNLRSVPASEGGWVNKGSVIYVRFPNYKPPSCFISFLQGTAIGFTNNAPVLYDGLLYKPGLLSAPVIEQSADVYTYDRMKFNSATIDIDNSDGDFDNVGEYFGNEFNILVGTISDNNGHQINYVKQIEDAGNEKVVSAHSDTNEFITIIKNKEAQEPVFRELVQYYIANINVGLEKASFNLKDKRERLSAKIPNKKFSETEYNTKDLEEKVLEEKVLDMDVQEVYGHCFGVQGVCIEGERVYIDVNARPPVYLPYYRYRFASKITRVDRIRVKMTEGDVAADSSISGDTKKNDGLTTVYDPKKYSLNNGWKTGVKAVDIKPYLEKGEVPIPYEVAKKDRKHENEMNAVYVDGIFIDKCNPLDIILDIMTRYSGVPYDNNRYDMKEIAEELEPLNHHEIGVVFDKPVLVYEAIEKLQSRCVHGFQFQTNGNRFTARLDNPKREVDPELEIKYTDILNLEEIEVDWNAEVYGSYTDIEYQYDYCLNAGKHWIDKKSRIEILDTHRVERDWTVHTLLANEADAKLKSDILLADFWHLRPLIKNIKLFGEKWSALRIYEIIEIDFRIPGDEIAKCPRHLIKLIEEAGNEKVVSVHGNTDEFIALVDDEKELRGSREFVGKLRCKVMRIAQNTETGETLIDVRKA